MKNGGSVLLKGTYKLRIEFFFDAAWASRLLFSFKPESCGCANS